MEQLMYGSTHTHFEDLYDTANDLRQMVLEFANLGSKKVTVTGHGNMFAYEDLKFIVSKLKETKEIPDDFEIIPGVEIYFGEEARHMVLIAEDYKGYQQICHVISESAKNTKSKKSSSNEEQEYLTPITTLENLQKNIGQEPGHVSMTSACVGGVFASRLSLGEEPYRKEVERQMKKYQDLLARSVQAHLVVNEWNATTKDPENKKLLKKENQAFEKAIAENDEPTIAYYQQRLQNVENLIIYREEHKKEVDQAKRVLKNLDQSILDMDQAEQAYQQYKDSYPIRLEETKEFYYQLESIFGKERIYFELQNHGLDIEKAGFNRVIELAYEVNNPNFIAANDVHIGDRKGSATWEQSVLRRNIEMFSRFKSINNREDEEEYGILTDDELKETLLQIIQPFEDKQGITHTPEEIVTVAISNIQKVLEPCHVQFPKIGLDLDKGETNFYPKFCEDESARLREEVEKGILNRFPNGLPEGYRERIEYEMNVIVSMGFSGYLLIVQEYVDYAELLGYLRTEDEIKNAPLTIKGLNQYIDDLKIPRIGMGVGPGRGSAAGSEIAYCMGITKVDPIPHGLMFERFLNPSRHSMPDIDSDFKDDIRDQLYEFIKERYGEPYVSKVCTKAYAHGKKAGDMARIYLTVLESQGKDKIEEAEIKRKYIQANKNVSTMISKCMKENKLNATKVENGTKAAKILYEEREQNPEETEEFQREQKILKMIGQIAGIPSLLSIHACACLISSVPLADVIPLAWNSTKEKMTTQCLYPQAENLGLLKMDLLNIKNLYVITKIMQECNDVNDKLRTMDGVQELLKDPRIFQEIFSTGRTKGIFQFESPGMIQMNMDFQPESFEDVILLVAAYRPGPLDFIPEVIAEKWWRKLGEKSPFGKPNHSIQIKHEKLQTILGPTYGVPIYQEQIMKIVQELAGYNMADADNIRKYMSKKLTVLLEKERGFFIHGSEYVIGQAKEKLANLKAMEHPSEEQMSEMNQLEADIKKMPTYIKGCVPNGICSAEEADHFFDIMMNFGLYAFNKSHALCYAQVAMYTAYQKLYYPELFYKHTLSNETKEGPDPKTKKMATEKYIEEMKTFGIQLLPPDPNKSSADYKIEDGNIRTGFGCVKGSSYVDYENADNLAMFIAKNPTISLTQVSKFIKLGMFSKIYPTTPNGNQKEIDRVKGNRTKTQDWLNAHGEDLKSYGVLSKEIIDLKKELTQLNESLVKENLSAEDAFLLSNQLEEVNSKLNASLPVLNSMKIGLVEMSKTATEFPTRVQEEAINDRIFEYEQMGIAFSAREDLELLQKNSTKDTIQSVCNRWESGNLNAKVDAKIAATVISKQKNKTGRGPAYRVTLMDKNGDTLQCGYWDNVDPVENVTCGYFDISYGKYINLKKDGVVPFELVNKKPTMNPKEFQSNLPTQTRTNPITGEPIIYQIVPDFNEVDEVEERD